MPNDQKPKAKNQDKSQKPSTQARRSRSSRSRSKEAKSQKPSQKPSRQVHRSSRSLAKPSKAKPSVNGNGLEEQQKPSMGAPSPVVIVISRRAPPRTNETKRFTGWARKLKHLPTSDRDQQLEPKGLRVPTQDPAEARRLEPWVGCKELW